MMSLGDFHIVDGGFPLLVGQRFNQLAPKSSSTASTRSPFRGPSNTVAGFVPKKTGTGDRVAIDDRERQRQVMSLESPTPSGVFAGRSKYRECVIVGIAQRATALLHFFENLIEAHDRLGLLIAAARQTAGEKRMGERLLGGSHVVPGNSFSLARNEVPVEPLFVVERKRTLRL